MFVVIVATLMSIVVAGEIDSVTPVTIPRITTPYINGQLHFASLGDWGFNGPDQLAVAKQIGIHTGQSFNSTFLLAIGDNFYDVGVANDTDPQWQTTYSQIYTAPSLNIPWYPILGNHDHANGRGQGEVDFYLNKRDSRWTMPYFWYTYNYYFNSTTSPVQNVSVQFILIDTINLTGSTGDDTGKIGEAQFAWLEGELNSSTTDWLIVVGHYPIWSAGEHGNNKYLNTRLRLMLQKYNADVYICGHDHTLQHLQDKVNTTQFIVSGNGAKRGTITPTPELVFGVVDPGFYLHVVENKDTLKHSAIDLNGKVIYEYTQNRLPKLHEKTITPATTA